MKQYLLLAAIIFGIGCKDKPKDVVFHPTVTSLTGTKQIEDTFVGDMFGSGHLVIGFKTNKKKHRPEHGLPPELDTDLFNCKSCPLLIGFSKSYVKVMSDSICDELTYPIDTMEIGNSDTFEFRDSSGSGGGTLEQWKQLNDSLHDSTKSDTVWKRLFGIQKSSSPIDTSFNPNMPWWIICNEGSGHPTDYKTGDTLTLLKKYRAKWDSIEKAVDSTIKNPHQ